MIIIVWFLHFENIGYIYVKEYCVNMSKYL